MKNLQKRVRAILDDANVLLEGLTAIAILAVVIFVIASIDWNIFDSKVTVYEISCLDENYDDECDDEYVLMLAVHYRPIIEKQQVVMWTDGPVTKYTNCIIANKKNWNCERKDGSEFGYNKQNFLDTGYWDEEYTDRYLFILSNYDLEDGNISTVKTAYLLKPFWLYYKIKEILGIPITTAFL